MNIGQTETIYLFNPSFLQKITNMRLQVTLRILQMNKEKIQNITYKQGKESEWMWQYLPKGGGKKHKKLLNIKNINLIKTCLKFFNGSLIPSGGKKKSKLVNITWGPSDLVLIYRCTNLLSVSTLTSHTKQFLQTIMLYYNIYISYHPLHCDLPEERKPCLLNFLVH